MYKSRSINTSEKYSLVSGRLEEEKTTPLIERGEKTVEFPTPEIVIQTYFANKRLGRILEDLALDAKKELD